MSPDNNVRAEIDKLEQRFAENSKGRVFAHLADAYRKAGEFAKAEGLILHGLKNHPNYISAYIVLGRVYLDSERFSDAHDQFSKVLDLDPQNLIALKALGDLALRGGRLEDARSWYERMLHIDPRNVDAQEGLQKLEEGGWETPIAAPAAEGLSAPPEPEALTGSEAEGERPEESAQPRGTADEIPSTSEPPDVKITPVEGLMGRRTPEPPEEGSEESAWEGTAEPAAPDMATTEPAGASPTPPGKPDDAMSSASLEDIKAGDPLFETPRPASGQEMDLDLNEMEEWTPGFLRDEDMTPPGETLDAESVIEELGEDLSFDVPGAPPAEAEVQPAAPAEDSGMVTETMAELYADQGLFEDALRVYRQLAAARPGDVRLEARMAELQQAAAEARTASAPKPQPAVDEAGAMPGAEPSPEAASTRAGEPEAGGTFDFASEAPAEGVARSDPFAASFDDLLLQDAAVAGVEPAAGAPDTAEPARAEVRAPEPAEVVPYIPEPAEADTVDVAEPAAVEPVPPSEEPAVEVGPAPRPAEPARDATAPPRIAAPAPSPLERPHTPVAPSPTGPETIETYLTSLLEFNPDVPPAGRSVPTDAAAPEAPEPSRDLPSEPSAADAASEDLEEFQEWLRGLKR